MNNLHYLRLSVVCTFFSIFITHAWGCNYSYQYKSSDQIKNIINNNSLSDPSVSTEDCERLNHFTPFLKSNHLIFLLGGDSFVAHGVSIGWGFVRLRDQYGIVSLNDGQDTYVNPDPSDNTASQMMRNAIIKSIIFIDLSEAINSIRKQEMAAGLKPIPAFH